MRTSDRKWSAHAPAVCLDELAWYALTTAPQREFAVELLLSIRGIQASDRYLPTYVEIRSRSRSNSPTTRKIHTIRALFPGYIFARFPYSRHSEVLGLAHVTGIVEWSPGVPQSIDAGVIDYMRQLVAAGVRPASAPEHWTRGDVVRILEGPFCGISGRVARDDSKRLIIDVDILGQRVPVLMCGDHFAMERV